ncbi:MAG: fumarate hydratase C-terminal domain-containing protein [Pigmentiphaga sp.]|uniref:fumarate hydratase C-terminal domain-containing protein n=1 Tax=Pigmentiphaga sp. TaxID=1977564 RepID=UPI0029ABF7F1|nr:fumarate hydratase C-terminal domain-containing protein [Pigmentiphaga sp.]MDX3907011.1 fumarate hydratase C-terminal domain-containing protein [Pigmentiphaga sp.]
MNTIRALELPLAEDQVRSLRVGEQVRLYGEIVLTAGMPTHERIIDLLERKAPLPTDLQGAALLHLGSYSREVDGRFEVLYLNPTTSTRFNGFMPRLIRGLGLRVVGGKGGLDAAGVQAMRETGCVYLSFLGGGCTLLSEAIREVVSVHWNDLVHHYRLVKLRVEGLGPATVGIDAQGNSLYGHLAEDARARLPGILARLDARRAQAPS